MAPDLAEPATTLSTDLPTAAVAPAVTLTPSQVLASQYDITEDAPRPEVKPPVKMPASPPKPVATAASVIEAPAPQHPRYLTAQAESLGIPDSVVKLASTEALGEMVAHYTKEAMAERRSSGQQSLRQGDINPPPPQPQPAQPVAFDWGEVEEVVDGKKVRRKIEEDEIHPALANIIKKLQAKVDTLESVVSQSQRQQTEVAERTIEQRIDAAFSSMPKVFGTGSGHALKGTPQFSRRKAVFDAIQRLPAEERQTMTLEAAVARFAKELFEAEPVATAATPPSTKKKVPATVDEWNQGSLSKPTDRRDTEKPNGRAKALSNVEQYLNEIRTGEDGTEAGDVTLDEFL